MKVQNISLYQHIKHAIARFLLSGEVAKVNMERESFITVQEAYKGKIEDFEAYKNNLTIVDLVREQLKGFNPRLLDQTPRKDPDTGAITYGVDDLPEVIGEVDSQDAFLAKMKALSENKEARLLADYLIRNQVIFSAKEAQDLQEINFGRATISGISLFWEEVDRMAVLHTERHSTDKIEFNENEVV